MARAARRGGGGGRGGSRASKKSLGADKYGADPADVALKLHDDDMGSDAEEDSEADMEEDVMALDGDEDEDWAASMASAAPGKAAEGAEATSSGISKGWRGADFYGGDDAGDDSDAGSDEDMVLEEAKKLEQIRAKRLKGGEDPLAALVGSAAVSEAADEKVTDAKSAGSGASKFESVFAAEAEETIVPRDVSQLSDTRKKGLVKSEAPELQPLLADFRTKVEGLSEILPLLTPKALSRIPASGAAYLRTKAGLFLNTLANLSYYILLRAEGGEVRTHPVISQLVWLRELNEQLLPMDESLSVKIKRALKDVKTLSTLEQRRDEENTASTDDEAAGATPALSRRRSSLRNRVEQMRPAMLAAANKSSPSNSKNAARIPADDLFRLPTKRRRVDSERAEDLDDVDPLLGIWRPSTTMGEQLSSVQQQLTERNARAKVDSADTDVQARPRRVRERNNDPALSENGGPGRGVAKENVPDAAEGEEDILISEARAAATAKKGRRAAEKEAREKAAIERQFKPEEIRDGRRATSKKILKNRGLVRERKKTAGNARKTNRDKYDKMVKRRKGAVREMREGAADGATYHGEETGVRTHLKKSTTLA